MRALTERPPKHARTGILAKGARVFLRLPTASDRDEWIKLRRANWRHLRAAEPTVTPGNDPCGEAAFGRVLAGAETERTLRLLVCSIGTKEIVGQISFTDISLGCFRSCFVGYWMGRAFLGRGFMVEALSLAVRYAFTELGLHRVEANIRPNNIASRAVAAHCGFRFEGRARRLLHLAGRWRDHERWAIIQKQR